MTGCLTKRTNVIEVLIKVPDKESKTYNQDILAKPKKKFTSKNHQNNQVYKGGEERKGLRTNHDKAWL